MEHPDPNKCRELGMLFLGLVESEPPKCRVNMSKGVYKSCGTSACHAGWFGVTQIKGAPKESRYRDGGLQTVDESFGYAGAASKMARFLGKSDKLSLKNWAKNNPDLWGNDNGEQMFSDSVSRGNPFLPGQPLRDIKLKDIAMHWFAVGDRIEQRLQA